MIDKKVVARHFSRAAGTYDRYAVVQAQMAEKLASLFPVIPEKGGILEIGSGTGLVTAPLVRRYPDRELRLVDISPAMSGHCKEKFANFFCISVETADGEQLVLRSSSLALIVSGVVFQWFREPAAAIRRYLEALVPGGFLLFSTLGPETFQELYAAFKASYAALGLRYSHTQGQVLPSLQEWEEMLEGFEPISMTSEVERIYYEDVAAFLHALQKTGANNAEQERRKTPPAAVRGMIECYRRAYPERIQVSYQTIYILVRKPFFYFNQIG